MPARGEAAPEPIRNRTKQPRDLSSIVLWLEGAAFPGVALAASDRREAPPQRDVSESGRPGFRVRTRNARLRAGPGGRFDPPPRVLDPRCTGLAWDFLHGGCRLWKKGGGEGRP